MTHSFSANISPSALVLEQMHRYKEGVQQQTSVTAVIGYPETHTILGELLAQPETSMRRTGNVSVRWDLYRITFKRIWMRHRFCW